MNHDPEFDITLHAECHKTITILRQALEGAKRSLREVADGNYPTFKHGTTYNIQDVAKRAITAIDQALGKTHE